MNKLDSTTPIVRRNRCPTPAERIKIKNQIEMDTVLLDVLENQLKLRRMASDEGSQKIELATSNLEEANSRLETTKNVYKEMKASLNAIKPSEGTSRLQVSPLSSKPTESTSASLHSSATNTTIQRKFEAAFLMEQKLCDVKQDIRDSIEAVSIGREDLQCATTERDMARGFIGNLESQMNALERTIEAHRDRLRPIWEVPQDVWRHIFQMVVKDGDPNSTISPRFMRTLVLSDVCYNWRHMVAHHRELWADLGSPGEPRGWDSINSVIVPSNSKDDIKIFKTSIPLLSKIHTLELKGAEAHGIIPYLAGVYTFNPLAYSGKSKIQKNIILLPRLRKVILIDYQGSAEGLVYLAEGRQVHLGGQLPDQQTSHDEAAHLLQNNNAIRFIEYCSVALAKRGEGGVFGGIRFPFQFTVSLPALKDVSSVGTGSLRAAMDRPCIEIAQRLQKENPMVWKTYWGNNRPHPKILFKLEIRNSPKFSRCENSRLRPYISM